MRLTASILVLMLGACRSSPDTSQASTPEADAAGAPASAVEAATPSIPFLVPPVPFAVWCRAATGHADAGIAIDGPQRQSVRALLAAVHESRCDAASDALSKVTSRATNEDLSYLPPQPRLEVLRVRSSPDKIDTRLLSWHRALRTIDVFTNVNIDLAGTAKLPAITDLDLGRWEGMPQLPSLKQLRWGCDLSDAEMDASDEVSLAFLERVPNLEVLEVSGCKVRNLAPLARVPHLRSLNLRLARPASFEPIAGLTSLE